MNTKRSSISRIARRARRCVAIGALASSLGCAATLEEGQLAGYEFMRGPVTAFSRNSLVCAPTSLGNAVGGLVGAPLALAVYPLVWPATLFTADDGYLFQIYGTIFWTPVLLLGGATGSVFLPPALFLGEDPCSFGVTGEYMGEGGYEDEE